jgi:outer membrane lipoprotein-sorting protein
VSAPGRTILLLLAASLVASGCALRDRFMASGSRFGARPGARNLEPWAKDAWPIVERAFSACALVDHVARQTTTVYTGTRPVTTQVEVAYRSPCLSRIVFLSPPLKGVTVLDDGERTVRLDPLHAMVVVGTSAMAAASDTPGASGREAGKQAEQQREKQRLALLEQNYRAIFTGAEKIAGRLAYRVELRPRHPGNPWKRLWIDRRSGVILASEDYDGQSRRTRASRVEQIEFRREPFNAVRPSPSLIHFARPEPATETEVRPREKISQAVGFKVLQPTYLPPGYRWEASYLYGCQCGCGVPAARLQYVDGLNTISVLQCGHRCQHESDCGFRPLPQGSAVRVIAGDNTVVVTGELDRRELVKIAKSLPGAQWPAPTPGKPKGSP